MNHAAHVLTIVVFGCMTAFAQDQLPMMRGPAAERIEQFKKVQLMEKLQMDEQTSIRFFARYNSYQEELKDLNRKRNELIDELQVLRRRNAGEAEFRKVLSELRSLADPAVEIRGKYFDDLSAILTPKQMAEYVIFERNFLQNLREIMRQMQRERRGRW
ncbi:MAG: hypothetical protein HBSIN02_24340 [Bacteroidia bacterium]|nr:MAG: hypothetical protein HBSIN02_24340 [Bacteroidia bacterium]